MHQLYAHPLGTAIQQALHNAAAEDCPEVHVVFTQSAYDRFTISVQTDSETVAYWGDDLHELFRNIRDNNPQHAALALIERR